jgi:hypothetical protein
MSVRATDASDPGQRTIEHLSGILYGASNAEEELRRRNIELSKGGEAGKGIDPTTCTTSLSCWSKPASAQWRL